MYLNADGIIFTYKGVGVFIKRSAERNDVVKTKSEHRLPQLLTGSEENRTYLIPSTSFDSSTELDSPFRFPVGRTRSYDFDVISDFYAQSSHARCATPSQELPVKATASVKALKVKFSNAHTQNKKTPGRPFP